MFHEAPNLLEEGLDPYGVDLELEGVNLQEILNAF